MQRLPLGVLVLFAVLGTGCGGSSSLLATVPPPVEFNGDGAPGLIELPAAGTYRGTLLVEHVSEEPNGVGGWSEYSVELSNGRGEATVGADGSIDLHEDAAEDSLFTGKLKATPAKGGRPASTVAILTAFDGHKEEFPYTLIDGSPKSLEITARGEYVKTGARYEFDRYSFVLRP